MKNDFAEADSGAIPTLTNLGLSRCPSMPSEAEIREIGEQMLRIESCPTAPAAKLAYRAFMDLSRAMRFLPEGHAVHSEFVRLRQEVLNLANDLRDEVWVWEGEHFGVDRSQKS